MAQRARRLPSALRRDAKSEWKQYPWLVRWGPGGLLLWDLLVLALLAWLLLARWYHWWNVDELPNPIAKMLPLISPWAGALGGVAISLVGIAAHAGEWGAKADKNKVASNHAGFEQRLKWNVWHFTRPFVGALFGSVAVLAVAFILGAVGVTGEDTLDVSPLGAATLFAVAFLVGYRDSTFRLLAERVIDTIFGPGRASGEQAVSFSLSDATLQFTVQRNQTAQKAVTLQNNSGRVVTFDLVSVTGDGYRLLTSPRPRVGAYGTAEVMVEFSPTAAQEYPGKLVVKLGDQEKTVDLAGAGT